MLCHWESGCDQITAVSPNCSVTCNLFFWTIDAWYPVQFCVLVPVVKTGNVSSIENYRAIALARILSKVLQLILLDCFQEYLATTEHQFGFKNKHCNINRGKLFVKQFLFI